MKENSNHHEIFVELSAAEQKAKFHRKSEEISALCASGFRFVNFLTDVSPQNDE